MIWSTLEDTRKWIPLSDNRMPTLQGKYKVPHFDAKGEINHVFTDAGVPTTFLHTSFYWDNMYMFGMGPAKGEDGELHDYLPDGQRTRCPALPPKTSVDAPMAFSRRERKWSERPSASQASI